MNLRQAVFCPDCEEVFEGETCTHCLNRAVLPLRNWIVPTVSGIGKIRKKRRVRAAEEKKPLKMVARSKP